MNFMGNVLIIDDDIMFCDMAGKLIRKMGHQVRSAHNIESGIRETSLNEFDVVLLDVRLPDGSGLDILQKIKENSSRPEVIIITGYGDPDGAEISVRTGAWDYIEKTNSPKRIRLLLTRVMQYRNEKLSQKTPVFIKRQDIIGSNPAITESLETMARAALSDVSVLITGETGTGKELFARAIHDNSRRYDKPFVTVDCASLPETLVESLLFGHVKGAFTGAYRDQEGLIGQAHCGTLFLDEIGELPLGIQKTFLRVLQERQYRPVGGRQEITSNFRLVASTNRNVEQMVQAGDFRDDLLFRIRSLTVELPPLCARSDDIKELTRYHVARLCDRYGLEQKGFASDFFDVLMSYKWPGNVRELFSVLDASLSVAINEPILYSCHLPVHLRVQKARTSVADKSGSDTDKTLGNSSYELPRLKEYRESYEKKYFNDLILLTGRDIMEACRISGISQSRLYALLKKYDISVSQK